MELILGIAIIAAGVALGLAQRGSIANALAWRPKGVPLIALWLVVHLMLLAVVDAGPVWVFLDIVACLGLVVAVAANSRVPGTVIVAAGLGLNLVVSVLNWGTPASLGALIDAGVVPEDATAATHVLTGPRFINDGSAWLGFLGETIALPTGSVISIGDVIVAVGVVLTVAAALTGKYRRNRPYQQSIAPLGRGPAPRRGPGLHPSRLDQGPGSPAQQQRDRRTR